MKNNRIAYVVKRYPRYSETFIVNEILAHEAAGVQIEIFSLYPAGDTHFQGSIAEVKAPVNYLLAKGIDCLDFWNAFQDASAAIPDLASRMSYAFATDARYVFQALLLAKHIRRKELDHIHSHFATSSTTVARLASHFCDVPYSFTAHAKDIYHQDVLKDDVQIKLRDAAAVITVSQFNRNYLSEIYGECAEKVCCIYNGMNLEMLHFSTPEDRPPEIIAVGRLVEKKGFSYLIDACATLKELGATFHCTIIGFGELEMELATQIQMLGLSDWVDLAGPLPQNEVIRRLKNASLLAAPCIIAEDGNRDGLPTILLESMAVGTPCVSTRVTGIPEVIQHGHTGLLAPERDAQVLAEMILRLLKKPELRVRLSKNARAFIEQHFDIRRNSAAIRAIFESAKFVERGPVFAP
jgi:colanic acid/amylovoran biosynthesis glycosyltransferase